MRFRTITRMLASTAIGMLQAVIPLYSSAGDGNTKALVFIENKGQLTDQYQNQRKDIDFVLSAPEIKIFVGKGQIHYQWAKPVRDEQSATKGINFYRLDVILEGAKVNAPVQVEDVEDYYENYYLPHCPGGVKARSCRKIIYKDVYPNIDWVLYLSQNSKFKIQKSKIDPVNMSSRLGDERGIKYDFVVHKGGNPADIRIRYEGAGSIKLDDGNLEITTPYGSISEEKPFTYDAVTGQEISSSFVLNDNLLSYNVAANHDNIVIDPTIGWGTYYGLAMGSETRGTAVAADHLGSGYLCGYTSNTNTITTSGSHQYYYATGVQNDADGFIVKFNVDASRAWATYFGGSESEEINTATCDKDGNLYVAGSTHSPSGIASSNTHQPNNGGTGIGGGSTRDGFVAKFNPAGTRIWGTFYGGTFQDYITGVAVDKDANVFVIGVGASINDTSLASNGAFQTTPASGFVAKFNSVGKRLWGTYYGGPGDNFPYAIACDTEGNAYMGGFTVNQPQLVTTGAHQPTYGGGISDGYLTKFNGNGQRVWGTMYGGTGIDFVRAIACDRYNNVFIGGSTNSSGAIATSGTQQPVFGGGNSDAFLVKFNAATGQRIWGTYYGSSGNDYISSIHTSPERVIYVGGNGGLATPGNYQTTQNGSLMPGSEGDGFIAKFNLDGIRKWGTFFGGNWDENATRMAIGGGKIYIGGMTSSHTGIATPNGLQPTYSPPLTIPPTNPLPPMYGFLAQFEADTAVYFDEYTPDTLACPRDTMYIKYGVTNPFRAGNNFTLQLSNATGSFANPTNINTVATTSGGNFKFWMPDTLTPAPGYRIRIVSSAFADTTWDNGKDIRVSEYPAPKAVAQFPICANSDLVLVDAGSGPSSTTYKWTGPGAFSIGQRNYNRPNVQATDSGYYVLAADNYSCITKDSVYVLIYSKPNKPTVQSNSPVCEGDTLTVWATSTSANITGWNWLKPAGYVEYAAGDTMIPVVAHADSGWYRTVAVAGGCPSDMDSVRVVVNNKTAPTVQIGMSPVNPGPWVDVEFTVSGFSNAGSSPVYQWTKNGLDIPGATADTYSATTEVNLHTGDEICVRMTSSAHCATPPVVLSCTTVNIDLGVERADAAGAFNLYPNPNNGRFTLKGKVTAGEQMTLHVVNVTGQVVYEEHIKSTTERLDGELNFTGLPDGMYVLRLRNARGISVMKFTVNK